MKKIRCSLLTGYNDCPRRSAASAFKELVLDAGFELKERGDAVAPILGTSSHKGVQVSLEHKMLTGMPARLDDCIDASIAEFDFLSRSSVEFTFDNMTPHIGEAHRQIQEIQRAHFYFFLPRMQPIAVEKRLYMDLGDGFVLSGQPDEIDLAEETNDFKTGVHDTNYIAQLGGYNLLARANGFASKRSKLNCIPRTSKNKPVQPFDVTYHTPSAEKIALQVAHQIKNQTTEFEKTANPWIFPVNPASMLCSAKFCPAYETEFCECTYKKPIKRSVLL